MSTESKMALGPQPLLPETWSEPKQKGYSSSWTLKKRAESPDTKYQGADSVTVTSMVGTTLILEFLQSLFFMSKKHCYVKLYILSQREYPKRGLQFSKYKHSFVSIPGLRHT